MNRKYEVEMMGASRKQKAAYDVKTKTHKQKRRRGYDEWKQKQKEMEKANKNAKVITYNLTREELKKYEKNS